MTPSGRGGWAGGAFRACDAQVSAYTASGRCGFHGSGAVSPGRNHRKIAVIDGTTAFVGGINIAKRYIDGNRLGKWRDEHLQLEGDIVGRLQRLFAADWQKVGGEAGDVLRHMPGHRIRSRLPVQIAWNDDGSALRDTARRLHGGHHACRPQHKDLDALLHTAANAGRRHTHGRPRAVSWSR